MKNRLSQETSPYLKQHEDNPVDWYPWGPEALERARRENKPLLLSVGYSACHWCHVMAHESFENPEIASLMNEHFVNVKVDREERPDLDHLYQNVAQAMTGGGGWPLTVFLTPDLRPFFGGTYFPPSDRYGRPGFGRLLQALARAYREEPGTVEENALKLTSIISRLEGEERVAGSDAPSDVTRLEMSELRGAAERLLSGFDWTHGGMGSAPKFPNPMSLTLFWRLGGVESLPNDFRASARTAAVLALTKMARGGIFDQLGGGFHRYSVDERWAVPHFEKMLYDNGLLLQLYSEALLTEDEGLLPPETRALFMETLRATAEYAMREMQSPEGGYYAAQDADSEGEEGKYFVWDPTDLAGALVEEEARVFALRYGVDASGNFEHGKTVLFQARSVEEVARETGRDASAASDLIASASRKLLAVRGKRVKPGLDDKILVSWNGLMVSGMAWTALALESGDEAGRALAPRVRESALRAYAFVKKEAELASGRLSATVQAGRAKGNGYLDDYAFLARAALDLTRLVHAESEARAYLDDARGWTRAILAHFADPSGPGYFFTSDDHEPLLQRPKTLSDQAIPSGTGVAVGVMQFLAEVDPGAGGEFEDEWRGQLGRLAEAAVRNPFGMGEILIALLSARVGVGVLKFGGDEKPARAAWGPANPYALFFSKSQAGIPEGQWQLCRRSVCELFPDAMKAAERFRID